MTPVRRAVVMELDYFTAIRLLLNATLNVRVIPQRKKAVMVVVTKVDDSPKFYKEGVLIIKRIELIK